MANLIANLLVPLSEEQINLIRIDLEESVARCQIKNQHGHSCSVCTNRKVLLDFLVNQPHDRDRGILERPKPGDGGM